MIRALIEIRHNKLDNYNDLFVSYFAPVEHVMYHVTYNHKDIYVGYNFVALLNDEKFVENLYDFRIIFPYCRARIMAMGEYFDCKDNPQHCRLLTTYEIEDIASFIHQ